MKCFISVFLLALPLLGLAQGNVGINTSSPQFKLDIRGVTAEDAAIMQVATPAADHFVRVFAGRPGDPNPFVQWKDGDPLRFATDAGGFNFEERMRLTSDGFLGIGTTTPVTQFHAFNQAHAGLRLETDGLADTSEIALINGITTGTYTHYYVRNRSDRFRIGVVSDLNFGVYNEVLNINYLGDLMIEGNLTSEELQGAGTRDLYVNSGGELSTQGPSSFISVNSCAFKPDNNGSFYTAGYGSAFGGDGTNIRLFAPIQLPHGKTIKQVFLRYRDLSAENITVRLMSAGVTGSGNSVIHSFTSSGSVNVATYTSPVLSTQVNNESFSYYIDIAPAIGDTWDSGFLVLYSLRVEVE